MKMLSAWIAVIAFLGTFFSVLAGVVSRTIFGSALAWTEELSRNLIVVAVFVGLYWVSQSDKHLAIVLPKRITRHRRSGQVWSWAGVSISVVTSAVCVVAAFDYGRGLRLRTPSLDIPLNLLFYAVALGMFGWTLHFLVRAFLGQTPMHDNPSPSKSMNKAGETE